MGMARLLFLILCLILVYQCVARSRDKRYDGDRVLRFSVATWNYIKTNDIVKDSGIMWREGMDAIDLQLNAGDAARLQRILAHRQLTFESIIEDVQSVIETTDEGIARNYTGLRNFDYEAYHTFDDYQAWQSEFASVNSDIASIQELGTSTEGRNINVLKLGNGPRSIIIHGGTHAREWISPITVVNTAKRLVESHRNGEPYLTQMTWFLVIVVNPDGYVYTMTGDRLWRKTRNTETPNSACIGVDTNRNWDAYWSQPGASNNPCSETYFGTAPFSEPEIALVSAHINAVNPNGYVDLHSYGQMLMYPYGYTMSLPSGWLGLDTLVRDMALAIQFTSGTKFQTGNIASIVYISSGGSVDYAYDQGTPCPFAVELPDKGNYGFLLPANQIKPVSDDMWAAWKVVANGIISGKCNR